MLKQIHLDKLPGEQGRRNSCGCLQLAGIHTTSFAPSYKEIIFEKTKGKKIVADPVLCKLFLKMAQDHQKSQIVFHLKLRNDHKQHRRKRLNTSDILAGRNFWRWL